jgi:5-methylcytosine-specific restriction enzyme subunit McrC
MLSRLERVLQSTGLRIIVETNSADAAKPKQYGVHRLSRDHIFQLYVYVRSQNEFDDLSRTTEGVLHPVVGDHLDEPATIQGHRYRFLTVDLAASAAAIRASLLSVASAHRLDTLQSS